MQNSPDAKYAISWYDPEQTILLCEVKERWSWEEARALIADMNEWCSTVQHGVYSLFHFQRNATLLPQGRTGIGEMRRLISIEHPNDQLIIFVGASTLVTTLVNIAGQIYGLRKIMARVRFFQSLDEALSAVAQHKSELPHQQR